MEVSRVYLALILSDYSPLLCDFRSKNRGVADTPFLRFAGRRGVGNLAQTGNTGSRLACWGLTIPTVAFRQDYSLLSDLYRASLYISSLIDKKLLERNFATRLMLCS